MHRECALINLNSSGVLSLPEQLIDAETAEKKDLRRLEESLQSLWEKARLVSDLLLKLKAENKELKSKLSSLELKERRWTEEIQQREREIEEGRVQLALHNQMEEVSFQRRSQKHSNHG